MAERETSKEIVLRQRAFIDALLRSEKDPRMRMLPSCATLMKKGQPSPLAIRARARV
jgi:hypothetical protein